MMRKRKWFALIHYRARLLGLFFGIILVLAAGRLFWLQVVKGSTYAAMGAAQTMEEEKLYSPRGPILDRNGKKLAFSVMVKSLYVDPEMLSGKTKLTKEESAAGKKLKDLSEKSRREKAEETAAVLAPILKMGKEDLARRMEKEGRFIWLERVLDPDVSAAAEKAIEEHGLKGLGFVSESKRYYPNGPLLANVLGFVGIDDKGLDGLEMSLDKDIRGAVRRDVIVTDGKGMPILHSTEAPYLPKEETAVYLTIDESIQFFSERALDRAMASTHADGGIIIVMDPKTGDILAMANRPSYDPNHFFHATESQFKNRAVVDMYEPGSTFKPVIAASALAAGTYTTEEVFSDPGAVWASGHAIRNWDDESYGNVKLVDIIKFSINTGFAHIGLLTGGDKLTAYAKDFGFGKETGIELPGEGKGLLFDPKDMRDIDVATMSIGQGIAVTPLQMVQAYSALANGGVMVRPHIIRAVKKADGTEEKTEGTEEAGRPVSKEVADTVKDMMEKEISEGGGAKARVPGYRMAGKTGTAQKLDTVHGGYLENEHIASFAGFGPVENPRAICLVVLDNPKGMYYGGMISAPVFSEVMGQIMRYLGIPAAKAEFPPDVTAGKRDDAAAKAPLPETGQEWVPLPDFRGWTMAEAGSWLSQAGLSFAPEGSGKGISQTPGIGARVKRGTVVTIHFSK